MKLPLDRLGGKLGLAIVAIGLIVIGLAYNAVASQTSLLAQMPYLVSGGLVGVSLVIVGAALLVTHGARDDVAALERKLDQLIEVVAEGYRATPPSDASGLVVGGASSFHLPSCRLVAGREMSNLLTAQEALASGLKACRVCDAAAVDKPRRTTPA